MTNFSISNALPVYLGLSGSGLNGGKIYIGQPNQDPQTFPKTVYWDQAGTDPVDQTNGIPTIGGYITRVGSIATIYVDGAYSIRVLDRSGSQVYYLPEVFDLSIALTDLIADLAAPSGSSMIGTIGDGVGAVPETVESVLRQTVRITSFGAAFDVGSNISINDATDDTAAWNAAITYLVSIGGGTLVLPPGASKVTAQIDIPVDKPIRIVGSGRRKVYPGIFAVNTPCPSTVVPVHSGRNAFRFVAAVAGEGSFCGEDFNVATLETGSVPTAAFGWETGSFFIYGATFLNMGVHGFTSAFDVYHTSGSELATGAIHIENCTINRNGYIARTLNSTQVNGFKFIANLAGQNATGGIHVDAQSAAIRDNILEGQPLTINMSGNYRGLIIEGNYFELNSGAYVISLTDVIAPKIGKNFWQNITATEYIKLAYTPDAVIEDDVIPTCDGVFALRASNRAIDPVPLGSGSAAFIADMSYVSSILTGMTEIGGYTVTAPAGPHYAIPNSAGSIYTSTGTGINTLTKSGLAQADDTYIGVALAITYVDAPALPPRLELRVNSGTTDGYHNGIFYNFDKSAIDLKGRTVLYFGVVRATASVASMQVFWYPFGLNPAAGLVCYQSAVAIYDMGTSLPSHTNIGTAVRALIPNSHVQMVTAAPAAGTWPVGYRLENRSPTVDANNMLISGWVNTGAGTPGTWSIMRTSTVSPAT